MGSVAVSMNCGIPTESAASRPCQSWIVALRSLDWLRIGVVDVRDTKVAISKHTVSIADRMTSAVTASTVPVGGRVTMVSTIGDPLWRWCGPGYPQGPPATAGGPSSGGGQRGEEGARAGARRLPVANRERRRPQVGGPRVEQGAHLAGDRLLVAHDGGVGRAGGAADVEDAPVVRQGAVHG